MPEKETLGALLQQRLLPLYYHDSSDISIQILQTLYGAGIKLVEYTARGEKALENFKLLKKEADGLPGLQLGIGTIKTARSARMFLDAGAAFVVCPTINTEVGAVAANAGVLWIPGCMTPTEIAVAESEGAAIVKIFPGSLLGPSYIRAVKELFPKLLMMPTGGVEATAENLKQWFTAGVAAVGMGSKLISQDIIAQQNFEKLGNDTAAALQLVQEAAGAVIR